MSGRSLGRNLHSCARLSLRAALHTFRSDGPPNGAAARRQLAGWKFLFILVLGAPPSAQDGSQVTTGSHFRPGACRLERLTQRPPEPEAQGGARRRGSRPPAQHLGRPLGRKVEAWGRRDVGQAQLRSGKVGAIEEEEVQILAVRGRCARARKMPPV